MLFKAVVLGSGGVMPTVERNCVAIYCKTNYSNFLIDAGQGFQKQMARAKLPFLLDFIILSHHHLDHLIGLIGYLSSCNLLKRTKTLKIYTPDPLYWFNALEALKKGFTKDLSWVQWIKITPHIQYMEKDLSLEFFKVDHSVPCFGVKIVSSFNTTYNKDALNNWGSKQEIAHLIRQGTLEKDGVTYTRDSFVASETPHFRVIYSGDTTINTSIWKDVKHEPSLVFHQCTHYFRQDQKLSGLKKHTHYQQIVRQSVHKDTKIVLIHLGVKITAKMVKDQGNNTIHFSRDGMVIDYGLKDGVFNTH